MKATARLFIWIIAVLNVAIVDAQEEPIRPMLLDKSALSGVGLKKIDFPDEPGKIFHQKQLFRGADISIYVVSTNTWDNRMDNFPFDEFVYMYHGEAVIRPDDGRAQVFHSGDYFFAPRGFTGHWSIRAGSNLHYELSVIATQRVDSSLVLPEEAHLLFDPSTLSGTDINLDENDQYKKVLKQGAELTFLLHAEKPKRKVLDGNGKDQMIRLLSGQVTITDADGEEHSFYTGDFLVLPNGCQGTWQSEGHGLIKYLIVEAS